MSAIRIMLHVFAGILVLTSVAGMAQQQTTGTPCSPAATTTVDGRYLPNPPPPFGGEINLDAKNSKPCWPPRIVPPKGAPNILLIMTDDQGYGISSTFGGAIPTPAMDRLAKIGLRYTQFHSTALCSPSRAAIITGRNHHSVGFGVVAEQATGYPGYDSIIGVDNGTIAAILKGNGYSTSWFGKEHNTPDYQYSIAGPYDQWPVGMGFDYFYGFMGGETDQWTPFLFRNTTQIFPWRDNPNYNMITGMADDAIQYLRELNASAPEKPFFLYYVPGGYGLYLLKGKPVFLYNLLNLERFRWEGTGPLAAGKHTLVFDFKYDGPGLGKGGTGTLTVDGKEVARKTVPHTTPVIMNLGETLDIGSDTRTGVDDNDYKVPFRFNGKIGKVTIKLGPEQLTLEDQKAKQRAIANVNY